LEKLKLRFETFFLMVIIVIDDGVENDQPVRWHSKHRAKSTITAKKGRLWDRGSFARSYNASNNLTMMAHIPSYYDANYLEAGFTVAWNQVECMAHVLNLGSQRIQTACRQGSN
jgi:hypothetical protein